MRPFARNGSPGTMTDSGQLPRRAVTCVTLVGARLSMRYSERLSTNKNSDHEWPLTSRMIPQRGVALSSSAAETRDADVRSEQAYLTALYDRLDQLRAQADQRLRAILLESRRHPAGPDPARGHPRATTPSNSPR